MDGTLVIIFNALSALLIIPLTTKLKAKWPGLSGVGTVAITSFFGVLVAFIWAMIGHQGLLVDSATWTTAVTGLGVNQTFAAFIYEFLKKFKKTTPTP